jgi:hypothetical protein
VEIVVLESSGRTTPNYHLIAETPGGNTVGRGKVTCS